jgi:hypothetical protein
MGKEATLPLQWERGRSRESTATDKRPFLRRLTSFQSKVGK